MGFFKGFALNQNQSQTFLQNVVISNFISLDEPSNKTSTHTYFYGIFYYSFPVCTY